MQNQRLHRLKEFLHLQPDVQGIPRIARIPERELHFLQYAAMSRQLCPDKAGYQRAEQHAVRDPAAEATGAGCIVGNMNGAVVTAESHEPVDHLRSDLNLA